MKNKKCKKCKKAEVDIRYQGIGYCFACAKKEEWYERLVVEISGMDTKEEVRKIKSAIKKLGILE